MCTRGLTQIHQTLQHWVQPLVYKVQNLPGGVHPLLIFAKRQNVIRSILLINQNHRPKLGSTSIILQKLTVALLMQAQYLESLLKDIDHDVLVTAYVI